MNPIKDINHMNVESYNILCVHFEL
jgi:hypothetical protein